MAEYIEREAAVTAVLELAKGIAGLGASNAPVLALTCAALRIRDSVPSADVVKAKHGRWIDHDGTWLNFQCSACGVRNHHTRWDYCPCCGAKMDGD